LDPDPVGIAEILERSNEFVTNMDGRGRRAASGNIGRLSRAGGHPEVCYIVVEVRGVQVVHIVMIGRVSKGIIVELGHRNVTKLVDRHFNLPVSLTITHVPQLMAAVCNWDMRTCPGGAQPRRLFRSDRKGRATLAVPKQLSCCQD
jgi:hypothetical protein